MEHIKEQLIDCVKEQMTHLEDVNTCELGEVIDMIKDIEEAIYYHTVTEAMIHKEEKDCIEDIFMEITKMLYEASPEEK